MPGYDNSCGRGRAIAQDTAQRLSHELHETIRTLVGGITRFWQPAAALSALRASERHLDSVTRATAAPKRFSRGADDASEVPDHLREHAALLERCVVLAAQCAEAEADAVALAGEHDVETSSDLGRYVDMARALRMAGRA